MDASGRLEPGQRFGRYQVVRLLGEGGMGSVYEVMHPELKKRFAIKTLLPNLAVIPEARARFLREGEAASRINHPNVVDVTDVGEEAGVAYLVMEFLEGETLGSMLEVRGGLRFVEAVDLFLPILSAVSAGHDEGVIHRDLKPQNVFLCKGRWGEVLPKVLDFGVSKLMNTASSSGAALTGTMAVLGTAAYMSPEQARGARDVSAKSDQYALGLIFYEMLTGRRAYPGENPLEVLHKIGLGKFDPPRFFRPDLTPELETVLLRMLALEVGDRFASLREVGRALMPLASEKARLNWSEAFGVGADAPTLSGALNPPGLPPSLQFPRAAPPSSDPYPQTPRPRSPASSSGAAVAGGTRVLPAVPQGGFSRTNPISTFNNGAAEVDISRTDLRVGSSGKRRGLLLGGMGAVAVVLGAGIWWMQVHKAPDRDRHASAGRFTERGATPLQTEPEPGRSSPALGARVDHEIQRPAVASKTLTIRAIPREALIVLDDGPPSKGELRATVPVDDTSHVLRVSADGYLTKTLTLRPGDAPPNEVELEAEPLRQPETTSHQNHARPTPSRPGHKGGAREPKVASSGRGPARPAVEDDVPAVQPPPAVVKDKPKDNDNEPRRGVNNALILQ